MTLKTSVYIATSLDGFIARESGELDWLMVATSSSDDHGYAAYMATIDTLVMGRNTFEKVLTFGDWPYPHKRVVVLSSTLAQADTPKILPEGVEVHPGPLAELVDHLYETGAKSLYLDGGQVIQSFLREGRLDELTITRIPVLLGSGIPLFGALGKDVALQHLRSTTFESGFGFWPTPTCTDTRSGSRDGTQSAYQRLNEAVYMPTPCASDAAGSRSTKGSKRQGEGGLRKQAMLPTPRAEDSQATGAHRGKPDTLNSAVRFRTPNTRDHHPQGPRTDHPQRQTTLCDQVRETFASPQANDWKSGTGFVPDGQHTPQLRHTAGGMLNPTWVGWLMGVPLGWDALPLMSQSALKGFMRLGMESYLCRQRMLLCSLLGEEDDSRLHFDLEEK